MKKILICSLLLSTTLPVCAQGLWKNAVRATERAILVKTCHPGVCGPALFKGLEKQVLAARTLQYQTARAAALDQQDPDLIWKLSGVMEIAVPTRLDEKELYLLAEEAAFLIHPTEPEARALTEKWFKKNAKLAALYALRKENGTPQDMLVYFTAKLYANCLVNRNLPSYGRLQHALQEKFGYLKYIEFCEKEL